MFNSTPAEFFTEIWNPAGGASALDFWLTFQDGRYYVKVEDWPKLSGIQYLLLVSMLTLWVIIAILWFLVMAEIQDGRHHIKIEDWPKFSEVQFFCKSPCCLYELQLPFLWFLIMAAIQDGREDDN